MKNIIRVFLFILFLFTLTTAGLAHTGGKHQKMSEPSPAKDGKSMHESEQTTPSPHVTEMLPQTIPHMESSPSQDIIFLLLATAGGTFLVIRSRRFWSGEKK